MQRYWVRRWSNQWNYKYTKNGDTVEKLNGTRFIWGGESSTTNNSNQSSSSKSNSNQSSQTTTNNQNVKQESTNETINNQEKTINSIATGSINSENIEENQLEKYNALTEEQRAEVIDEVNKIVSTANANIENVSEDTRKIIDEILENNNIESDKNTKLRTISFDRHLSLDFPVNVTVDIDKEIYDVSDKIYVYHILEDGTVEYLGEAKKEIEDNKVVGITFQTTRFSDFFTTIEFLM